LPGFNPNEEHAALFDSYKEPTRRKAAFALRDDLNRTEWRIGPDSRKLKYTSKPYVLVKYQVKNADNDDWIWEFRVFDVERSTSTYPFTYREKAGKRLLPPYPLSRLALQGASYPEDNSGDSFSTTYSIYSEPGIHGPFFVDYNHDIWTRCAGEGNVRWFYPLQEEFWYDLDGDGENDLPPATPLPWLSFIEADEPETPIAVKHEILWPDDDIWSSEDRENVPVLFVGETLLEPRRGLPDILNQSSVQILFDNAAETEQQTSSDSLVRLYDPLSERRVALPALPVNQLDLRTDPRGNKIILDLPFHLQTRCFYDAKSEELVFRGYYSNQGVGDPILLPNVMSVSDKNSLLSPRRDFSDAQFENAVSELHGIALDRFMNQGKKRRLGPGPKALSAGAATGEGYVTLGFSTDEPNCAPLPVALEVIRVEYPLYRGEVKVIQPDNVFDERLTLRHSSDFGCEPEKWYLEWQYCQQLEQPGSPGQDPNNHWKLWDGDETGGKDVGLVQLTIRGDAIWALKDMWFSCRYRRITDHDDTPNAWSNWTAPQLHESWVKRVVRAINPYDQRVKDFHTAEVHSQVDMIGQAGPPFSGNIALTNNPSNINNKGLIEVYSTLLDRASSFSLDRGEYREDIGVSNTLLLASSRVADLYMLLGNEAYADAVDPTIGFGGTGGDHSVTAPSLFCFQNQLGTLIEEELTLLRGLDKTYPYPLYNRLAWNFASGEGEVAYVLNYNISDQDGTGDVDEYDARQMYPQGHGDAWGHYLTAIKTYYDLLRDSDFTWIPRIEAVVVAQVPVEVDYLDERKFARIAAAKARTGAEIVDLTYRQTYSQDVVKRLSGYADADQDRAWGVSEWGRRAGQGAYFDWVVANAILPAQDPNEFSIKKIDRTTVLELREIVSCFNDIQTQMDKADLGLNPVGVARDVVPFDINPSELVDAQGQPTGRTHFEQIFDRAVQALSNSLAAFNLADRNTQQLRQQQDNLERFRNDIANQEAELEGRLIEVFGYPYGDDIGPTGTYPEGYDGPDLYHFDYVDVSELLGRSPVTAETFSVNLNNVEVDDNGQLHEQPQTVTFNLSKDGLGLIKPTSWSRPRRAPGELQFARSDLLQARARFQKALLDYDSLIQQIRDQAKLLQAQYDLNDEEIRILNRVHNRQSSLNEAIKGARERQLRYRTQGRIATLISNAMAEALPTAAGLSNDVTAPLRSVIRLAGVYVNEERTQAADEVSLHELDLQQSKEIVQSASNIELTELRSEHGAKQQLAQLEQLIRSEASLQLELFTIQESMQQASSRYVAALARGERILQDRLRFRKQTAANIQDYRYKDMAFRVFRTDAVSKYRAQFDMAALYVLLAAKAYDYETCLASTDGLAGTYLIDKICRQRTIGQIDQGIPIPGRGLAGILAELRQNFDLLKGQLGFNNPQVETNYFSLRNERFRIIEDSTNNSWRDISNSEWLDTLASHKKNMWQVEDCRRFCKPFSDESEEPSIVLEFETRIDSGQNFFGKPLGADAYYAPENFATKIRSVGIWFSNYDTTVMSPTPRVYLIPVGEDRMRAPSGDVSEVRCWQIREQAIPEPFPIQAQDYFQLTPMESLSDYYGAIRRHGRLRAYPDGGFNVSEMTYNSRLVGRSVWNTKWLLVIPGSSLWHDADEGIERFIHGVTDIRLFFKTYAYPGY